MATIAWYKYVLHFWSLSNYSFPQMKKEWAKITCVILWSHLHMITEVNRMWGKFGLLNYHAVIIFPLS